MKVGNMQLIGQKDRQNDYFAVIPTETSLFAVVADGITNKKIGKFASVITVETLKYNFKQKLHEKHGILEFYNKSFDMVYKKLNDNIYGNKVGATLISIIVESGILYFASVGDCTLFLYRKGELININGIYSDEIKISKIKLMKNDVVMLCSKGAHEGLTEMEILCKLSEENHPYDKCQSLARLIQKKCLNYQDNATIVVVEKMV